MPCLRAASQAPARAAARAPGAAQGDRTKPRLRSARLPARAAWATLEAGPCPTESGSPASPWEPPAGELRPRVHRGGVHLGRERLVRQTMLERESKEGECSRRCARSGGTSSSPVTPAAGPIATIPLPSAGTDHQPTVHRGLHDRPGGTGARGSLPRDRNRQRLSGRHSGRALRQGLQHRVRAGAQALSPSTIYAARATAPTGWSSGPVTAIRVGPKRPLPGDRGDRGAARHPPATARSARPGGRLIAPWGRRAAPSGWSSGPGSAPAIASPTSRSTRSCR